VTIWDFADKHEGFVFLMALVAAWTIGVVAGHISGSYRRGSNFKVDKP
jgi:hypothetical protein